VEASPPAKSNRNTIAREVRPTCRSHGDATFFFPVGTFPEVESELAAGFADYLTAMNEPSLSCGESKEETYRLLWLHAFEANPIVVRVSRVDKSSKLLVNAFATSQTTASNSLPRRAEKPIAEENWRQLTSTVQNGDVWLLPTQSTRKPMILDGDTWLLEIRVGSAYHAIWRAAGEERGGFRDVCRLLLDLAEVKVAEELSDRR
jgi:hypothetical protein